MPAGQRRNLDLRTFDQLIGEVDRLQERGYDKVGDWTLDQILDHLAKAMTLAMDGKAGPPRPIRWLLKPILSRILNKRSMPRMPAPKSLRPKPNVEAGAYQRFAAAVDKSANLIGDQIDHPAFGWMSMNDWQQLQLIHASRHLSFLVPHELKRAN